MARKSLRPQFPLRAAGAPGESAELCSAAKVIKVNKGKCPKREIPKRVFYEITLGMKWMVVTKEMIDADGQILLDARSLLSINICLPKCFALVDDAFEYSLSENG